MSSFAIILPAAGKSSRFGSPHYKKVYAKINNKPVWQYSVEQFQSFEQVKQILLVIHPEDKTFFSENYSATAALLGCQVALGGKTRTDSVENGLTLVDSSITHIAVHDAARPCVKNDDLRKLFDKAQESSAAILATPITSTLKKGNSKGHILSTKSRENLWAAQTPQAFSKELLLQAYRQKKEGVNYTDESSLVEPLDHPITMVEGSRQNIKITTQDDLELVKAILSKQARQQTNPFPF
ncbi:MAG: 2-C-methyl-D-erythritol 4-phosphate cytidylyltransferase [Pirellulaceae bacterium]|nr:2-C-methyl-D-erythritol 4-phosphate cytidylyltransferase [Pirellulaceae bacterium]